MDAKLSKRRSRSGSPPPWRKPKILRRDNQPEGFRNDLPEKREQESFARERARHNLAKETQQMKEWVSKEDEFVLKQSKKKAQIRVREGRAKTIDWLAVILSVIDPTKDLLDDDSADPELDIMDPEGLIDELGSKELQELEKDIDNYEVLESNRSNRAYWNVRSQGTSLFYMR
jgi:hypothetical protein